MPLSVRETMPEDYDNDLLREGILLFKVKEFAQARRYLERALSVADDPQTKAQANYYLAQLADDPVQKRHFIEETLAIDMTHAGARRMLAILDGRLDPASIVNPEALPAPSRGVQAVEVDRFTCPHCGGRMVYAPDGASLVCEYCSGQQQLESNTPADGAGFFYSHGGWLGLPQDTLRKDI